MRPERIPSVQHETGILRLNARPRWEAHLRGVYYYTKTLPRLAILGNPCLLLLRRYNTEDKGLPSLSGLLVVESGLLDTQEVTGSSPVRPSFHGGQTRETIK